MSVNPYEILGVREGASQDEIKRAYRKKAKENHPDLHPNDPKANERMQQVNLAYDMLTNPDKYRARQAGPGSAGYGQGAGQQGGYAGYGRGPYGEDFGRYANRQNHWQYAWYASNGQDPFEGWQDGQGRRRQTAMVSPLRAVVRLGGGLLALRFILSFLRLLMFGFWGR